MYYLELAPACRDALLFTLVNLVCASTKDSGKVINQGDKMLPQPKNTAETQFLRRRWMTERGEL